MAMSFDDFIYYLIEVQSGARMGKDPSKKGYLSQFVVRHRLNQGKRAMSDTNDPAKKEKIKQIYNKYAFSTYKDLRTGKANQTMRKIERERETAGKRFELMDKNG